MKPLGSSSAHQRFVINTTFTALNDFAPLFEQYIHCSCIFRGSPLSSFPPHTWFGTNRKERKKKMTYICFVQWPALPVPSTKAEELEVSGIQMKGLSRHGGCSFSLLMVPKAESKIKVKQLYQLWQTSYLLRKRLCYQRESASEGGAVLWGAAVGTGVV